MQSFFSVRTNGAVVTLNDCTFFADGNQISKDNLGKYIAYYYPEAEDFKLTVNGELISIEEMVAK